MVQKLKNYKQNAYWLQNSLALPASASHKTRVKIRILGLPDENCQSAHFSLYCRMSINAQYGHRQRFFTFPITELKLGCILTSFRSSYSSVKLTCGITLIPLC